MNFTQFGKLILVLGVLIACYGGIQYLTNLDEKFDSSKSQRDPIFGRMDLQEALRVREANDRHKREREAATPYFIGGAIVAFVGYALWSSSKKKNPIAVSVSSHKTEQHNDIPKAVPSGSLAYQLGYLFSKHVTFGKKKNLGLWLLVFSVIIIFAREPVLIQIAKNIHSESDWRALSIFNDILQYGGYILGAAGLIIVFFGLQKKN
jgi:hypothetical protein